MRKLLLLLPILFLYSCGVYHIDRRPDITHVLGVTSAGDTIKVSVDEIRRNPSYYNDWDFYYYNSWYSSPQWIYSINNPSFRWRVYRNYYQPKRIRIPQYTPPKTYPLPTPPRRENEQLNRGRSNQTQPRVQQPQPRVQSTPRPPQRTQSPVRQQQTPKTTRGGIDIKQ